MIGMMNGGTGDVPVEFYGSRPNLIHGAPSVYSKPKLSQTLSYTQDGRILINVLRIRTKIVCEKHLKERKTRRFKNLFSPQTSLRSLRSVLSSGSRRSRPCSPSKPKTTAVKRKWWKSRMEKGVEQRAAICPTFYIHVPFPK
uniref:Uncharacterized protein n=1 Tax=Ditylenchus dipsaci TaxID=166011 RepID=A0A915EHR7_9BILA